MSYEWSWKESLNSDGQEFHQYAASYSETTLDCHLDISGACNFQKTPATGWRTMIRSNFGKYIFTAGL
jgi:hypothetical protein